MIVFNDFQVLITDFDIVQLVIFNFWTFFNFSDLNFQEDKYLEIKKKPLKDQKSRTYFVSLWKWEISYAEYQSDK